MGFLFLVAFFNEELSAGLMGPAALDTLSKLCFSSVLVSETLSYRAELYLRSRGPAESQTCGLSAPVTALTAASTKDLGRGDGVLIEDSSKDSRAYSYSFVLTNLIILGVFIICPKA